MSDIYFVCNGKKCDGCPFDDCMRPETDRSNNEIAFDRKGKVILRPERARKPRELPLSVYGACMEKITDIQLRIDKLEAEKLEIQEFLKGYGA